jgi:hypothetical protein
MVSSLYRADETITTAIRKLDKVAELTGQRDWRHIEASLGSVVSNVSLRRALCPAYHVRQAIRRNLVLR